ncbi:hypothetical protein [Clostridium senegalense]|uniref:Uncharacterized protein n=1 Tax=Clostridium senegalense TaxID=1465809 RepID=A0A6M0H271_9CLOT|nr:hypothetical protein [Clostridium senegalense]NEU03991.1 hypothetical protein [Clostridium senegalense]
MEAFMQNGLVQALLIILVVLAIGILVGLLKKKNIILDDKFLNFGYTIIDMLDELGVADENTKKILRIIMDGVRYVEENFNNMSNPVKEETALNVVKENLENINGIEKLTEEDIKTLIRLSAILLGESEKKTVE